tara:strand:- start:494 stop:601 length:108 start_codon:yes stop_codon:yes gene_type:complete
MDSYWTTTSTLGDDTEIIYEYIYAESVVVEEWEGY